LATSSATDIWNALVGEAAAESTLWAESALPASEQQRDAVFSTLCEPRFALGVETIYEGYLLHFGRPRLFAPADADTALLLGDYLYAHGLVRIAATGSVEAVNDIAELISLCAQAQADGSGEDWAVWAATASGLGAGALDVPRQRLRERRDASALEQAARAAVGDEAVERARAAHDLHVG
jgi:signal transduction histidine kinase